MNAMLSGQQSEMLATDNRGELAGLSEKHWALGVEMDSQKGITS